MALTLDATTLAAYTAASTADARAQAVIDALSGTVYCRVYDGSNTLMGEGTMAGPWATRSGSVITVGEVTSFSVLNSGTPNAASWYLRFETAGGRWVRGPFGAGGNFTWSLGTTWNAGQSGSLGTVTLNAKGTIAIAGAAIAQAAGSAGLTVSGGGGSASLSWSAPTTNSNGQSFNGSTNDRTLSGYRVYGKRSSDFVYQLLADVGTTSANLAGLAPGTWTFYVVAYDADGDEGDPVFGDVPKVIS